MYIPYPSKPSIVDLAGMEIVKLVEAKTKRQAWEVLRFKQMRAGSGE